MALAAALAAGATAEASNREGFVFGPRSGLTAGAAAPTARGAEAAVYNPAGLIGERDSLQLGVNAYAFRSFRAPGAVDVGTPDGTRRRDLRGTSLVLAPPTTAATIRLSERAVLGTAVYVDQIGRATVDIDADTEVDAELGGALDMDAARTALRIDISEQVLRARAAVGVELERGWSIGVGVEGVYRTLKGGSRVYAEQSSGTTVTQVLAIDLDISHAQIGLEPTVGVLWESAAGLRVGVVMNGPELAIATREADTTLVIGSDGDAVVGDLAATSRSLEFGADRGSPFRVRGGVSKRTGWGGWALAASGAAAVREPAVGPEQSAVWNVAAGVFGALGEQVTLGGGVFTDRSAQRDRSYLTGTTDFYGLGISLHRVRPVRLAGTERNSTLEFHNTWGVRYAAGFGEMARYIVDAQANEFGQNGPVRTRSDEVTATIISGLRF